MTLRSSRSSRIIRCLEKAKLEQQGIKLDADVQAANAKAFNEAEKAELERQKLAGEAVKSKLEAEKISLDAKKSEMEVLNKMPGDYYA